MIHLPRFTFLNAPAESGKTTLANMLSEQDTGLALVSFAEPIRNAMAATFYPAHPLDHPDFRDSKVKRSSLPGTNVTHRDWMVQYSIFMKTLLGPYIFGDLAKKTCMDLSDYYPRFLFDDNRYTQEIHPFSLAFGRDDCLMIHISRQGKSWDDEKFDTSGKGDFLHFVGARHASLNNNGKPEDMLSQLERILL
jgi:hypothetical protein